MEVEEAEGMEEEVVVTEDQPEIIQVSHKDGQDSVTGVGTLFLLRKPTTLLGNALSINKAG